MAKDKLPLTHPGKILLEEFLEPMKISRRRLAKDISVPARGINEIVKEKRRVTADTALRLSRYFGTSAQFWMNLQNQYELDLQEEALEDRLDREVKARAADPLPALISPEIIEMVTNCDHLKKLKFHRAPRSMAEKGKQIMSDLRFPRKRR